MQYSLDKEQVIINWNIAEKYDSREKRNKKNEEENVMMFLRPKTKKQRPVDLVFYLCTTLLSFK